MERVTTCIFDLDGTIIDSKDGIEKSIFAAIRAVTTPVVGPQIKEIFSRIFEPKDEETVTKLIREFRKTYDEYNCIFASPYEDVEDCLQSLRQNGIRCFVATNKPVRPTVRLLEHLNLTDFFQSVYCPDSHGRIGKTKSSNIRDIIKDYSLLPREVCLIGDTEEDMKAAEENSVHFVAALYGYGRFAEVNGLKFCVQQIRELLYLLNVRT